MKRRKLAAVAVLAAVVVAAASLAGATSGATRANVLTVWLQVDAQSGWPDVVAAANQQFQSTHPGWTVDVQYQTWGDHLGKFDATLAAGNVPDVIEMGNTEMTKYMAAGAFADLTSQKSSFPNSSTWLAGLTASASFNGRLFGVPYYAGSRVVTYRSDLFKKAGIAKLPTSLAGFTAAARKLGTMNKSRGFSPVYIAGTDWYFAMSFVYDRGGAIARYKQGKWVGALRLRTGPGRVDRRPGVVQLLRRQEVHERHEAVRDARQQGRYADARLPRRLRSRRPDQQQCEVGGGRLDQGVYEHDIAASAAGQGEHPQRDEPAR